MIAIPNYGLGNVGSLINSLNKIDVPVDKGEPLALELESFVNCVIESKTPKTDAKFGKSALDVALFITKQINSVL